jgi:hypothetical protein
LSEFGAASFVPEREFNAVPESEFVIDDPEVVFDDVFRGSDLVGDVAILESLGNEFNDAVFAFTGNTVSVAFGCKHSCLR